MNETNEPAENPEVSHAGSRGVEEDFWGLMTDLLYGEDRPPGSLEPGTVCCRPLGGFYKPIGWSLVFDAEKNPFYTEENLGTIITFCDGEGRGFDERNGTAFYFRNGCNPVPILQERQRYILSQFLRRWVDLPKVFTLGGVVVGLHINSFDVAGFLAEYPDLIPDPVYYRGLPI
jgi:hypothetical protein